MMNSIQRMISFLNSWIRMVISFMICLERILLSCNLFKFNDYKKRQERSLLVSTKNVINIKGTCIVFIHDPFLAIKRKIPYNKIKAITLSSIGTEFVIHVPDEYDYRYSSYDKYVDSYITFKTQQNRIQDTRRLFYLHKS